MSVCVSHPYFDVCISLEWVCVSNIFIKKRLQNSCPSHVALLSSTTQSCRSYLCLSSLCLIKRFFITYSLIVCLCIYTWLYNFTEVLHSTKAIILWLWQVKLRLLNLLSTSPLLWVIEVMNLCDLTFQEGGEETVIAWEDGACFLSVFEEISVKSCCDRLLSPGWWGSGTSFLFLLYGIYFSKTHFLHFTVGNFAQPLWQIMFTVCCNYDVL